LHRGRRGDRGRRPRAPPPRGSRARGGGPIRGLVAIRPRPGVLMRSGGACELCEAARMTTWYHEDDTCWVADCEICRVPMVVWRRHGPEPPGDERVHMLDVLERIGAERFGKDGFSIDAVMRQIPA